MFKLKIRCDVCGQFISLKDLDSGKAIHQMITPDSEFTCEDYESFCKNCRIHTSIKVN